jgi:adhesin transport system membrane fusion protein
MSDAVKTPPPAAGGHEGATNAALIRAGQTVLKPLEKVRVALDPVSRRVLGTGVADKDAARAGFRDFEVEADAVMSRSGTQRAQKIVRTALVIVVLLIVWASLAHVDEVTRGDGKVIPSRQLQLVQSLDGGVVTAILVREGDVVEEAVGSSFVPPDANSDEEKSIVAGERRLYEQRQFELSNLVGINRQQLEQRQQELSEMRARKSSAERSVELTQQELTKTKPLLASGAVSEVDILRLERDIGRLRGDVEQASAQIARVQASIGEAQRKIQETEFAFRNEARRDLADVMGKLNALNEGAVALNDRVDKSQIKSPVRGRVQRLLANTVGGVVQPGKDIVEIVPLDDALVLEAKVQPKDIAFIHPGQEATVKFTAYDFSIYGGMTALVENISPDTIVDERGNAFYLVRVRTTQAKFSEKLPIIPGMTAEVDILTGSKTVMSYLLKPVLKGKAYALRER